jgi:hypothetical protein
MSLNKKLIIGVTGFLSVACGYAGSLEDYCIKNDGKVASMKIEFNPSKHSASQTGFSKKFCTFEKDRGFIAIGLETYASKKPNVAATIISKLPEITQDSPLWNRIYANPGYNICKNLGGSAVAYYLIDGGFTGTSGSSDICMFGDGSMVSAWSLIYMVNKREHYNEVKDTINSPNINFFNIPGI